MSLAIQFNFLIATLIFSLLCGMLRYSLLDQGSKVICILLISELLSEISAHVSAVKYHTNIAVYNIDSIVEFFILCIYFNSVVDVFCRNNVGLYVGIGGVIIGILNLFFLQPINVFNSNFSFFEGFSIIAISLFGFFRLLIQHDQLRLFRHHHFWLISIILVYWSITFLNFGFYGLIGKTLTSQIWILHSILFFAGIFLYLGIAIVFVAYPKLQVSNE